MEGRLAVFLCNLKPMKMRGIESQGMIMCASTPETVQILVPPAGSVPGDQVICHGYDGQPDVQLNPKKKIWEAVAPDLQVNDDGYAAYKGTLWEVVGKDGPIVAESLTCAPIK